MDSHVHIIISDEKGRGVMKKEAKGVNVKAGWYKYGAKLVGTGFFIFHFYCTGW